MVIAGDLPPDPGVQTPAKQLRLSVDRVFGQNGEEIKKKRKA
jgi:hypothetical protein